MELLTVILSAIAAVASLVSVCIAIKTNKDNKRHLQNRLEALDEEYNGAFGHYIDPTGRDKVRVEMNTIKKDLRIE